MPDYLYSSLAGALCEGEQGVALVAFEDAEFSRSEIIEIEIADPDTNESLYPVANRLNHVADLAFESGFESHLHAARREPFDGSGAGLADLGEDAFFKLREDGILEGVLHRDVVDLFDAVFRMGESLGEFSVVAENEEAFGIEIEAPDMHQMMEAWREKVVDGGAAIFIATGANQPGWLVENDGLNLEWLDFSAGGADGVTGLHAVSGIETRVSIDNDFTLLDQRIAGAAGANPGGSEILVEANSFRCHGKRKSGAQRGPAIENLENNPGGGLTLALGLGETDGALAFFPFTALFHELYALKALHYRALAGSAAFTFQRVVLGHKI